MRELIAPSRGGFSITRDEVALVDELLATEPPPDPQLGECRICECKRFAIKAAHLGAAEFLQRACVQADRGAIGYKLRVSRAADGLSAIFTRDLLAVHLTAISDETIPLEPKGNRTVRREFDTGKSTVGEVVIAIVAALGPEQ